MAGRELLASGGNDGTVGPWDPQTGTQHSIRGRHQGAVSAVCAISLDGRHLLASGNDETVRLWDLRPAPAC